ncbi:MAG: hypothetical protein JO157_07605 [Acetobacteraceae bacterium]|nr:hypothetical protein [Acetobacteraceae bacterium]
MLERASTPPALPLRYDPSVEVPEKEEGQTDAALTETMLSISETTFKDGGHGLHSVHAKSHGLLRGELRVPDGLPPVLAQGVAAQPSSYPVIIRLSTAPGDILDDSVSAPRAMALKIVGVEGERLPGTEGDATQDFVMANGPAFTARTRGSSSATSSCSRPPPIGPSPPRSWPLRHSVASRRCWRLSATRAPQ